MRRRSLTAVIVLLPLVGWLRFQGERYGLFGTSFGLAVMVVAAGALACATAWRAADVADRSGAMLRNAWQRLGSRNAYLEAQVAEQAAELTRAHVRLRAVLEAVTEAVVVTDAAGQVVMANSPAARLLARTEAELKVEAQLITQAKLDGTSLEALGEPIRSAAEGRVYVVVF